MLLTKQREQFDKISSLQSIVLYFILSMIIESEQKRYFL
jgi:uncharacterized membrane protein (DUF485 family)